jgi:hypothetical protein
MPSQQLIFNSPAELDSFFREGREFFNDLYVKKLVTNSVYWQQFEEDTWPANHETSQRAFRFGRGFYDPCTPFRKINDTECATDVCDAEPEVIERPGNEAYTFELLRKEFTTDWFCIESLLYRLFPAEEILQFEQSNARITKNVFEEFLRNNYIGGGANKWVGFADDDGVFCGLSDNNGFFIPEHTAGNTAGYDMCAIRVKCPLADLSKIALLSLDLLDDALIELQDEDDAFRLDLQEETGMPLLNVIIPDTRVGRALYYSAKQNNGYWDADTDFDSRLSKLRLGVSRIIGDYAFGYDIAAPRFNADDTYNATLPTYDSSNPDTWPRLVRVPRYKKVAIEKGCSYIPNRDYRNADFSISPILVGKAMKRWNPPMGTGYGQAQMPAQNYAGMWNFRNPDWPTNRYRKNGFYEAQIRLAAQVVDPTLIHSILHRLPKSRNFAKPCCDLNTGYVAPSGAIDCYSCAGVGDIIIPE